MFRPFIFALLFLAEIAAAEAQNALLERLPVFQNFEKIHALAADSASVWAATDGGAVQISKADGSVLAVFNDQNSPLSRLAEKSLALAEGQKIWIGPHGFDGQNWLTVAAPAGPFSIEIDGAGQPIFGQNETIILPCGAAKKGIQKLGKRPTDGRVFASFFDEKCGPERVEKIAQLVDNQWVAFIERADFPPDNQPASLDHFCFGPEGALWVLDGQKIRKIHPLGHAQLGYFNGPPLAAAPPRQVEIDGSSDLFSVSDGAIWRLSLQTFLWQKIDAGLPPTFLEPRLFVEKTGQLWAFSPENGLFRWQGGAWQDFSKGLKTLAALGFLKTKTGQTWLLNRLGSSRFDGQLWAHFSPTTGEDLPEKSAKIARADSSGGLWLAYENAGDDYNSLAWHDGLAWKKVMPSNSSLASFDIDDIQIDAAGRAWFLFKNATASGFECARFDGSGQPNWLNFAQKDTFFRLFRPASAWAASGQTLLKTTAAGVDSVPFFDSPLVPPFVLQTAKILHVWPDGRAWAVGQTALTGAVSERGIFYFDGQNWSLAGGPEGYSQGHEIRVFDDRILAIWKPSEYLFDPKIEAEWLFRDGSRARFSLKKGCSAGAFPYVKNLEIEAAALSSDRKTGWILSRAEQASSSWPPFSTCPNHRFLSIFDEKGNELGHFLADSMPLGLGRAAGFEKDAAQNSWLVFAGGSRLALDELPLALRIFGQPEACAKSLFVAAALGAPLGSAGAKKPVFEWQNGWTGPLLIDSTGGQLRVLALDFLGREAETRLERTACGSLVPPPIEAPVSTTATTDASAYSSLQIFPNPSADGLFWIENEHFSDFEIFDAMGRLLEKGRIESPFFDLSRQPSGVYFLKIGAKPARAVRL